MHVVLGTGNLGCSIIDSLLKKNMPVTWFSTRNEWKYPDTIKTIIELNPSNIWCCCGSTYTNQLQSFDLNIRLAIDLSISVCSKTRLHFFSVIQIVDHDMIWLKRQMEDTLLYLQRKNTVIYRLSHLYGSWRKIQSLEHKIKANKLPLTKELIVPTPVTWVANILTQNIDSQDQPTKLYTLLPDESISVKDFAAILKDKPLKHTHIQPSINVSNHPLLSQKNIPSWLTLWKEYIGEVDGKNRKYATE